MNVTTYMGAIAAVSSLNYDSNNRALFGQIGSYTMIMTSFNGSCSLFDDMSLCKQDGSAPSHEELKVIVKEHKGLMNVSSNGHHVRFTIKYFRKNPEDFVEAVQALANAFSMRGWLNCCESCGEIGLGEAYIVGGQAHCLCESCFLQQSDAISAKSMNDSEKKENPVAGAVGAFFGSLIGAVVIVILSQLGYVALLSGIVMAVATLKGYEKLAGKMSIKGIVISSVIMLGMIYVGNQVDWAIAVASAYDVDFFTAFRAVGQLVQMEYIDPKPFYMNLALIYLFTVLGAVPTVWADWQSRKDAQKCCRLTK